MATRGRVMFSAAEDGFESAAEELREVFGADLPIDRVGPDLGVLGQHGPDVREVAAACEGEPLAFVRHLSVELARTGFDADEVVAAVRTVLAGHPVGTSLAVQVWVSGSPGAPYGSGELFARLARELSDDGLTVTRGQQEHALSVCVHPEGVSVGLNRTADSLSDWPGGRMRLSRDRGQVSRAEFKLEELFRTVPLPLNAGDLAVDLGASPGGWTRILRQYGLYVWAVDPGELDPAVADDDGVRHARTTAGEFLRATGDPFDLVVNDMRMDPVLSCRVMLDAARQMRPGGTAVVTLKTGTRQPVETFQRCLSVLRGAYEIVFARQLHHNRHEVTVALRRRRGGGRPRR